MNDRNYKWFAKGDLNAFFALLPCVAELVRIVVTGMIHVDPALLAALPQNLQAEAMQNFRLISMLGRGFILTAMLWGAAAAHMIDHKMKLSAVYFLICAALTSFGLMHSASAGGGLYLPWRPPDPAAVYFTAGYIAVAVMLFMLSLSPIKYSATEQKGT